MTKCDFTPNGLTFIRFHRTETAKSVKEKVQELLISMRVTNDYDLDAKLLKIIRAVEAL